LMECEFGKRQKERKEETIKQRKGKMDESAQVLQDIIHHLSVPCTNTVEVN